MCTFVSSHNQNRYERIGGTILNDNVIGGTILNDNVIGGTILNDNVIGYSLYRNSTDCVEKVYHLKYSPLNHCYKYLVEYAFHESCVSVIFRCATPCRYVTSSRTLHLFHLSYL